MEAFLELVLNIFVELILPMLETLFGGWCGDFNLPDTRTARILLGLFILCLGGLICRELRAF